MSADAGGGAAAAAQYAALAKNATGAGAARLTRDACGHAGLFAFGELLEAEGIQALAGTEHAGSLELLRLFAYGTWTDYRVAAAKEGGSSLPALSDAQARKLRQLTVVSLAERSATLTYDELQATLELGSTRELEDFLINECMYAGLIRGTLDPQRRCLHVRGCAGRDVPREQLGALAAGLAAWADGASGLLAEIERSQEAIKQAAKDKAAAEVELNAAREAAKTSADEAANSAGAADGNDSPGGSPAPMAMEVGAEDDARATVSSKRRR